MKMNKLLIESSINLNNAICELKCQSKDIILFAKGSSTVYLINEQLSNLEINMDEGSLLNVYMFDEDINKMNIVINQNNHSKVNFNYSYFNNLNSSLKIDNNITGNDNESILKIRNISNKGLNNVEINAVINKSTKNNNIIENVKGYNDGGKIKVLPNILCESNEVSANHMTTIGNIDDESLNYLKSKGISKKRAKKLIINGVIISNMDLYMKESLKKLEVI